MVRSKIRTVFACAACGAQTPKWMGRCPDCGQWGTLGEEPRATRAAASGPHAAARPVSLKDVDAGERTDRLSTRLEELDRVLGGGLVPGSAVLIGGPPGIGKSTLLLQAAHHLASDRSPILYVSAEESTRQVKMRAERLGVAAERLFLLAETGLERIIAAAEQTRPAVLVVDSLQTVSGASLESAPGTVSQVREVAGRLTAFAKATGCALFLVGHVTKEGAIAGPRLVEHLVDTVLYFEETAGQPYRMLRAWKNRFGSTHELGVFEMGDAGLQEVTNPSALFLAERPAGAAGSVVAAAVEGSRPLLVEVQALVSRSSMGTPRRTALGIDPNRAALVAAILEKKAHLVCADHDLYVNVAGGVRLREPAADLPVALAIASSFLERPIDADACVFGEVGLTGEVRAVARAESRLKESERLGFRRVILPTPSAASLEGVTDLELCPVRSVEEAIEVALVAVAPQRRVG